MKKLCCSLLLSIMFVSLPAWAGGDGYFLLYQAKGLDLGLGLTIRSERYYRFGGQVRSPEWIAVPADTGKKVSIFGTISDSSVLRDYLRNRSIPLSGQLSFAHVPDNPLPGHGGGITYRMDKNSTISGAFSHDHVLGNGAAIVFRKIF